MPDGQLTLNDDGFAILGNALLLGYLIRHAPHWIGNGQSGSHPVPDRAEISEGRELRDLLDSEGALDDRIVGAHDITGQAPLESFPDLARRLNDVINSGEQIATLRLEDIAFTAGQLNDYGLASSLKPIDPFEFRTPLARLGPTATTRRLRKMVVDHFRTARAIRKGTVSAAEAALIGPSGVRLPVPP